jgi:hypothetical protein
MGPNIGRGNLLEMLISPFFYAPTKLPAGSTCKASNNTSPQIVARLPRGTPLPTLFHCAKTRIPPCRAPSLFLKLQSGSSKLEFESAKLQFGTSRPWPGTSGPWPETCKLDFANVRPQFADCKLQCETSRPWPETFSPWPDTSKLEFAISAFNPPAFGVHRFSGARSTPRAPWSLSARVRCLNHTRKNPKLVRTFPLARHIAGAINGSQVFIQTHSNEAVHVKRSFSQRKLYRAIFEGLETRTLMASPQVLPAGPRADRPDYVAPGGNTIAPASEPFQWEYSGPRLVYDFDQPVQGVSLSTHTLTTLYAQRQRSNPYPLTNVPVTINDSGYENDDFTPKLNSTNSGVSWSKTTASGTTILLESDGARPNFKLRITTATGSQQWSFEWDGFDRVTDVTSIDTTGDGENLYLISMGSSGWVKGTSAASGTVVAPPDIALTQSGNTATFNLPNGLADGYYDVVMSSDGITNAAGENLDADPAALGNQDYRYSFFSYGGDANHDRVVDSGDFAVIDSNIWNPDASGFSRGDFNYDGVIDNADYSIINFNYGTVLPLPVTEPNTLTASSAFDPGSIRLQWLPPANETISGFRIWRSTDGVNYEQLPDVLPATATQWDDTSLGDGAKRTYRIRAFKTLANGAIEYSPGTNKASAVTNLPGPVWITASNFTGDAVTLNWTDRANGETAYRIEVANSPGDWQLLTTLPAQSGSGGDMSYTASGLDPLGFAEFRVMAMTAAADSARSTGWRNTAYNTTVLKLKDPAFNGLFSPSPLESDGTTLRSLGGDETITANFTAPRHTKLDIGFRHGVGGEGVDHTFVIKLDGVAIFTESWTNWRQDEEGEWQCDFSRVYGTDVQPLNNGPDPSTGPDPTWNLRVKHTSPTGVLTFETTGLSGEDAWTLQTVGVVATLPYVSGIGALNGGEPAQNGLFYLRATVNDEIFNVEMEFSGTAASGLDYVPIPLQKEFDASSGDPTMYVPVVVKDDPFPEGGESVLMTIVSGAGYAPGSYAWGGSDTSLIWIGDDEQPPPPPPLVGVELIQDGSEDPDPEDSSRQTTPIKFRVFRQNDDLNVARPVSLYLRDLTTTREDYVDPGEAVVVTIQSGFSDATLEILPKPDPIVEPFEQLEVQVAPSPTNAYGFADPTNLPRAGGIADQTRAAVDLALDGLTEEKEDKPPGAIIPRQRAVDGPDGSLKRLELGKSGKSTTGTLRLTVSNNGEGRIIIWKDDKRQQRLDLDSAEWAPGQEPKTLWVEGDQTSSAPGDVKIELVWTNSGTVPNPSDEVLVTVSAVDLDIRLVSEADEDSKGAIVVRRTANNAAPRREIIARPTPVDTLLTKTAKVKVFDAEVEGNELSFDGVDNRLAAGQQRSWWVQGDQSSEAMRGESLTLTPVGGVGTPDSVAFTVLWVDVSGRFSDKVSEDNNARNIYRDRTTAKTFNLNGPLQTDDRWGYGVEIVGAVGPKDFDDKIYLAKDIDFYYFDDQTRRAHDDEALEDIMGTKSGLPGNDTSNPPLRDDDPNPNGRIFDLDIAGMPLADNDVGDIVRFRANWKSYAIFFDGINKIRCSDFYGWYTAQSYVKTAANDAAAWTPKNGVANDNKMGEGQLAKLTWDLK